MIQNDQAMAACLWRGLTLAALAVVPILAHAQSSYPAKNVRVVVPFQAGGGADFITRLVAQKLTEGLGQPVVVDNRSGASGNIGTELVARSAPDGYSLLSSSSTTITAALVQKVPFDVVRDFSHVSMLATSCLLVTVHPSLPVKTMKELVALARAKGGDVNYASSGAGTAAHMLGEALEQSARMEMVHVPYKGNAAALTGLLSGEVAVAMPNLAAVAPLTRAGRLRPLAVSCAARSKLMPEVPTTAEVGYPGAEWMSWWGLSAPAGTPRPIVNRLAQEVERVAKSPEVLRGFESQGAEARTIAGEAFDRYVAAEWARWEKVVKAAQIKPR